MYNKITEENKSNHHIISLGKYWYKSKEQQNRKDIFLHKNAALFGGSGPLRTTLISDAKSWKNYHEASESAMKVQKIPNIRRRWQYLL